MLEAALEHSRQNRLPLPPLHRISLAEGLIERNAPGDLAHARRLLEENTELLQAYAPDFIWGFLNRLLQARLALRADDLDQAEALVSSLEATLPRQPATNQRPEWWANVLVMRADLDLRRGRRTQARTALESAVAYTQATYGNEHAQTRAMRHLLATFDRTGTIASNE